MTGTFSLSRKPNESSQEKGCLDKEFANLSDQISRRDALSFSAAALMSSFAPALSAEDQSPFGQRESSWVPTDRIGATKITHHEANLGDVRLHYVTAGTGDPIVLLHGWPETCYQWRHVIPILADRYCVIAPDLRGIGDSSAPAAGYDKRSLANDVWRLLHDVLGYNQWCLAGHSRGAVVAYSLAAAHPDAVRRLAIIGASPLREGHEYKGWWHFFNQVPELPEGLIHGRERLYFGWFYEKFAHPSFKMPEEVIAEYLRTFSQPEHLRAALEYYRTMPQDMAYNTELARTFKLPMPVLAVNHEGPINYRPNQKTAKNYVAESMRELAQDVSEVMFANCGYLLHEEKPDLLADVLGTFFDGSKPEKIVG